MRRGLWLGMALLGLAPLLVHGQSLSFSDENADPMRPSSEQQAAPAARAQGPSSERRVLDELASLDGQIQRARGELDEIALQVSGLEATRAVHQEELAQINAALRARRAETSSRVRALYGLHRRGLARVVFGAENPTELLRRARYLVWLVRAESGPLREISEQLAAREAALDALRRDEEALAAARAEIMEREAGLTRERSARLSLLDDLRTERELALLAEVELGQTRSALAARLGGEAGGSGGFRSAFGRLPWPASGRLLRRFGAQADPATGRSSSLGIDLKLEPGVTVRAVFPGTVTLAESVPGYGLTVALAHGPYTTVYAHGAKLLVRKGEPVEKGQTLLMSGNTGLASEDCCTLTFELRYNGTPQDPLPWLAR